MQQGTQVHQVDHDMHALVKDQKDPNFLKEVQYLDTLLLTMRHTYPHKGRLLTLVNMESLMLKSGYFLTIYYS